MLALVAIPTSVAGGGRGQLRWQQRELPHGHTLLVSARPPLPTHPILPRHTHSIIFSLNPSQSHHIVPLEFQRDARITVSTLGEAWHCQPMSTISDAFTSVFKVTLSDAI